jgi:hypothetical protein
LFHDAPAIHHGDEVRVADGGEAVSDDDHSHGPSSDETIDRLLDLASMLCDATLVLCDATLVLCDATLVLVLCDAV